MIGNLGITFVVPAYNCENVITSCLDSILSCNLTCFEIIIIDDASTDQTYEKANEWIVTNGLGAVLRNKNNLGVSSSRNFGVSSARFPYIVFVDSDDLIVPDVFCNMIGSVSADFDILIHTFIQNGCCVHSESYSVGVYPENIVPTQLLTSYIKNPVGNSIITYVWDKIYRTDFLKTNNLIFDSDMNHFEDIAFNLRCFSCRGRFVYSKFPAYDYRNSKSGLGFHPIANPFAFKYLFELLTYAVGVETSSLDRSKFYTSSIVKNIIVESKKGNLKFIRNITACYLNYLPGMECDCIKNPTVKFIIRIKLFKLKIIFT